MSEIETLRLALAAAESRARQLEEALADCAEWLRLLMATKSIIEPPHEEHIAASVDRARAVLSADTAGRDESSSKEGGNA